MKQFVLVVCCCCLLTGSSIAQQLVGIRGGYGQHRLQFNVPRPPEQQWAPGVGGGVVFRTLNSPHLGLQLELLLEQKGWHLFPGTGQAYHIEEQHLSLPIQSVVMVGKGRLQFVIAGGAFATYIMGQKVIENGTDDTYGINYERQPLLDWQYGLLGGLGPAVKIGRNWLQLEGRFAYTLSNRLEPNLARFDAFNVSQQMSVTVALVWLTRLSK